MPHRCAFGCKNTDVAMHVFPKPDKFPERFKVWVNLVGGKPDKMSDREFYQKKRVCDIHFSDEVRVRFKRLSALAVPSLHLPVVAMSQDAENIDTIQPGTANPTAPINQLGAFISQAPMDIVDIQPRPSNQTASIKQSDTESFTNVCRTCANVTEFVIPIFADEGLQNNLAEKIHKHLPIKVSEEDVLPHVVCYQCANTLLAWHDLVECCVQADADLRQRLTSLTEQSKSSTNVNQSIKESEEINEDTKYAPHSFQSYRASTNDSNKSQIDNGLTEYQIFLDYENADVSDDDDEPLSNIVVRRSTDVYENFYSALVNFRNHFVTEHKNERTSITDSDSSDSDLEENYSIKPDVNEYDDLTKCNMRKDKMNDETRRELSQVQTKINGKVYFTCTVCGKKLSSSHTYVYHKRIHTGERPCVCHICGKQFRTPNGLQRHLTETHEKQRFYTCILCHKSFANSQNLTQHMRIHTGERPFVCTHCGKRFTQSGSLHAHLKTHSEQYPHHCAECGAKFRLRSGLTRHKLKHTGERPHVCIHCGKGFRQKHELNSHIMTHSDAKPHACGICGTAFRQRKALRHHCKRLHEGEAVETSSLVYSHVGPYE